MGTSTATVGALAVLFVSIVYEEKEIFRFTAITGPAEEVSVLDLRFETEVNDLSIAAVLASMDASDEPDPSEFVPVVLGSERVVAEVPVAIVSSTTYGVAAQPLVPNKSIPIPARGAPATSRASRAKIHSAARPFAVPRSPLARTVGRTHPAVGRWSVFDRKPH